LSIISLKTRQWIASQKKCLEILQGINRADPENASTRRSLAIEYVNMALVLSKTGSIQLAIEDWQKSLAVIRGLVALDSEDKFNRHYLGTIVAAGGTILIGQHKPEAALKQFDEARSIYLSLRDAGGASWFEIASAAQCTVKMAEVELLRGNATVAADEFNQALALAEPLIARKPPNLNALYAAADAYSGLGDLVLQRLPKAGTGTARLHHNWEEARSWYSKSLATWHQIEHPNRSTPANSLDAGDPAQVAKKLARCDAALSHK
jgi:tetratricopeptide (TPR) repeat protein